LAFGPSAAEPNEKAPSRTEPTVVTVAIAPALEVDVDAGQDEDFVVFDPFAPAVAPANNVPVLHTAATAGATFRD